MDGWGLGRESNYEVDLCFSLTGSVRQPWDDGGVLFYKMHRTILGGIGAL